VVVVGTVGGPNTPIHKQDFHYLHNNLFHSFS
jgi:hypothetical protein